MDTIIQVRKVIPNDKGDRRNEWKDLENSYNWCLNILYGEIRKAHPNVRFKFDLTATGKHYVIRDNHFNEYRLQYTNSRPETKDEIKHILLIDSL